MKKTLILNGSPRKNGDTVSLLNLLLEKLDGEVKIVDCYRAKISPCVDCRKCREIDGCVINDDMQGIYDYLATCDNVVIASPLYFSQPTGELLNVASRFQTYFSKIFFKKEKTSLKEKKGGVILVGGGNGSWESAYKTAKEVMKLVNVKEFALPVVSHNTDKVLAKDDLTALHLLAELTEFLNG